MGGLSHIVSGDIASFRTPSRVPIESLKFHFLPKQAEGTPSPENPIPIEGWTGVNGIRSGRNLLNPFTNPIWVGWDTFYTINSDGSITVSSSDWRAWAGNDISPILLPKGTYTFSWEGAKRIQIATSNDSYGNAALYYYSSTGGHVTFTLTDDGGVKFKLFGDYPLTCTVQIEPGLIAHDYVPYSEKAPIEQILITFPSTGKNIVNWPTVQNFTKNADLYNGYDDSWIPGPITVDKGNRGKKIVYSATIDNTSGTGDCSLHVWIKNNKNEYVSKDIVSETVHAGESKRVYAIVNLQYNSYYHVYLGLTIRRGALVSYPMAEYGEEMTSYEPYSSDNTFYGGYIDPVAGEIVAEYCGINSTWGEGANNTVMGNTERRNYPLLGPTPYGAQYYTQKCNVAKYGYDFAADYVHVYCAINSKGYLFLPIGTDDDTAIQITYKLATPIHIPIPAEDMKAFLDHNNFWSDANDITEVTYAVTESKDMLATRKKAMDFDRAHHKKVKWNNMAGAMNDDYWQRYNESYTSVSYENGEATLTVERTITQRYIVSLYTKNNPYVYANHRYYMSYMILSSYDNAGFGAEFAKDIYVDFPNISSNIWTRFSAASKAGSTGMGRIYMPYFKNGTYQVGDYVKLKNVYYVDLTLMFGAGNEPTKAEFEHICEINGIDLTTYQPYDEGSDRWLIIP